MIVLLARKPGLRTNAVNRLETTQLYTSHAEHRYSHYCMCALHIIKPTNNCNHYHTKRFPLRKSQAQSLLYNFSLNVFSPKIRNGIMPIVIKSIVCTAASSCTGAEVTFLSVVVFRYSHKCTHTVY